VTAPPQPNGGWGTAAGERTRTPFWGALPVTEVSPKIFHHEDLKKCPLDALSEKIGEANFTPRKGSTQPKGWHGLGSASQKHPPIKMHYYKIERRRAFLRLAEDKAASAQKNL